MLNYSGETGFPRKKIRCGGAQSQIEDRQQTVNFYFWRIDALIAATLKTISTAKKEKKIDCRLSKLYVAPPLPTKQIRSKLKKREN